MKEPPRLCDCSESSMERGLLRNARSGAPRGAKQRAMVATAGVLGTTSAGAAAGTLGAAGASAAGGLATPGAKVVTLASIKWLGAMTVTGVVAVTGGVAVRNHLSTPRVSKADTSSTWAGPALQAPAHSRFEQVAPTPPLENPPPASALESPKEPVGPVTATHESGDTLGVELAGLDDARRAIVAGDPAQALAILDRQTARYPRGSMAPERALLRIEALSKAGDRAAAARAAQALLLSDPQGPYSARLRSLLAQKNR